MKLAKPPWCLYKLGKPCLWGRVNDVASQKQYKKRHFVAHQEFPDDFSEFYKHHSSKTQKIKSVFYSKWDLPVAWAASWIWGQIKAAETRGKWLFLSVLSTLPTFLVTQLRLLLFQKHENYQSKCLFPHPSWDQKTKELGQRYEGQLPMALPILLCQINKSTGSNLVVLESFRNTTLPHWGSRLFPWTSLGHSTQKYVDHLIIHALK